MLVPMFVAGKVRLELTHLCYQAFSFQNCCRYADSANLPTVILLVYGLLVIPSTYVGVNSELIVCPTNGDMVLIPST